MNIINTIIGECCEVGDGTHAKIQRKDSGIKYLSSKNFKGNGLDLSKLDYISEEDFKKHFRVDSKALTKPQTNDILMSIIGTMGMPYIVKENDLFGLSSSVCIIRPINEMLPQYLYYWMLTPEFQQAVINFKSGVAQGFLSLDTIRKLPLLYPKIDTQKKIVYIISKYDNLIKNNLKRIKLLEESADLIYKEWFVNFRFPGYEKCEFVEGIPTGWKITEIGDICTTVGGGTPSTKNTEYWDNGEITWITPTDITNNKSLILLNSKRKITKLGLDKSSARIVPPNTILMTSRATLGYFALIDSEVCTNQGFINIIPNEEYYRMYMLFNLIFRKDEIIGIAGGATYKEISKGRFNKLEIVVPDNKIMIEFNNLVYSFLKQVRVLKKQIRATKEARDILIPKLIMGEIEV